MTYFGFLLRFLVIPILLLGFIAAVDHRRGKQNWVTLRGWSGVRAIVLHVIIAVVYTTPWDNYLVATQVWWYKPELVTGITIGWVPIEEYTFFVLQPILTGLWLLWLMRNLSFDHQINKGAISLRKTAPIALGVLWLAGVFSLALGWEKATYLALIVVWAVPPMMLQLAFGADILWKYGRLLFLTIVPMTLYLGVADALAIDGGTWTINPEQTFHFLLGGILPIEEFIFFLVTNILITLGTTLLMAQESQERLAEYAKKLSAVSRQPEKLSAVSRQLSAGEADS